MIHIDIDEMQFECNKVTLIFSAFCDVCGAQKMNQRLDLQPPARLNVGCSNCETIPSFTHEISSLIVNTVRDLWRFEPDDVKAVEEKLRNLSIA